jgi:Ca-activated chloride channel homolog
MRVPAVSPSVVGTCFIIVALDVAGSARARAQGMVLPREALCVAPAVCMDSRCAPPPCPWRGTAAVARTSTQVRAQLADRVLRYEVTETFVNRGPRLGEADYIFPLPRGAAFQDLQLSINGELVAGEALNAQEARGVYEEIVRRQRDPALVEWMGAGLLRARIFPIAAGEEKKVVVRFQTVAEREGDALRVDYVGPGAAGGGPVDAPAGGNVDDGRRGRSSFELSYAATDGLGTPYSPTHELTTARDGDRRTVRAEGGPRDITILLPTPRSSGAGVTMLPYAPGDGPAFTLITVAPPVVRAKTAPRDVTFVLDISGSMSGHKLEQARAAGRQLLATLMPRDRFRLIDFSTDVRTFRDGPEYATPEHVREAEAYLDALEANGSTNIAGALAAALGAGAPAADRISDAADRTNDHTNEGRADDAERLPLVLFITDGEPTVGERSTDALVAQAVAHLGRVRLFTFGLGADVNTALLEQLALQGHGTAQFVRPDESVERAVALVAHRLTDPVITDVTLHADGVRLTGMLPTLPTDLFAGQDLVLLARYEGSGRAQLRFTGRTSDGPVSWTSDVTFPERERANPFVARLWATQRVGYLEAERHKSGGSAELDAELRMLGERYGIPTELTSYLVREPALAMNGVAAPTSVGGVAGAHGMLARRAPAVTGTGALAGAKMAAEQRAAVTLAAADSSAVGGFSRSADSLAAGGARLDRGTVRHVGDRTFVLRDSVWTDTRYVAGGRVIRVQAFSDAYFAVLDLLPELRASLSVGDRVLVAGRGTAIEIGPGGATRLTEADRAALRAAS